MKRTQKNFIALSALALPLLITLGCAGTESHLATVDEHTTNNLAIADPAFYHIGEQDEQVEEIPLDDAPFEPEIQPSMEIPPHELAALYLPETDPGDQAAAIEYPAVAEKSALHIAADETLFDGVATNDQATRVPAADNLQEAEEVLTPPAEMAAAPETIGKPQKNVIHFGFDQYEMSAADIAELQQHARYLLQYPNLTLVVSGHTDSFGPKSYNQRLSELRAQSVAGIILAQGVPESQIKINALADGVPVTDPKKYSENRRVELTYQDAMLVSNP